MTRPATPAATVPPMHEDSAISVLIADDQVLVRAGFRAILETQPGITVCGEAADGRAAIDLARLRHPEPRQMPRQRPAVYRSRGELYDKRGRAGERAGTRSPLGRTDRCLTWLVPRSC